MRWVTDGADEMRMTNDPTRPYWGPCIVFGAGGIAIVIRLADVIPHHTCSGQLGGTSPFHDRSGRPDHLSPSCSRRGHRLDTLRGLGCRFRPSSVSSTKRLDSQLNILCTHLMPSCPADIADRAAGLRLPKKRVGKLLPRELRPPHPVPPCRALTDRRSGAYSSLMCSRFPGERQQRAGVLLSAGDHLRVILPRSDCRPAVLHFSPDGGTCRHSHCASRIARKPSSTFSSPGSLL